MRKLVFEVDTDGFIIEVYVADFDDVGNMCDVIIMVLDEEGNPAEKLVENLISVSPTSGMYRARWTGEEWVEDMTQSEIDELNKPIDSPPTDTEILGQQMTEREIESMVHGQQLTDMDLRLFEMEVAKNV